MVHQLILLLAIASTLLHIVSSIPLCTGPSSVTFNSTDFTITGPCPNDTVIAPVGSTVQYTCEYVDNSPLFHIPYWHIAELIGTPFLESEGGDHNLTTVVSSPTTTISSSTVLYDTLTTMVVSSVTSSIDTMSSSDKHSLP